MTVPAGELLWAPPLDGTTAIERFGAAHGYTDYETLWKWSVTDLDGFWAAVWDWFGVLGTYDRVLSSHEMPGARWFEGAALNYAEHALRGNSGIIGRSQTRDRVELTADELRRQVARAGPGCNASVSVSATASSPTCRTSPKRSSPSLPPPASGRSGRRPPPSSGRRP